MANENATKDATFSLRSEIWSERVFLVKLILEKICIFREAFSVAFSKQLFSNYPSDNGLDATVISLTMR